VFLAGQLTVFANIEYFRRYFAASYTPANMTESKLLIQGEEGND
jgi:hypothetical protein